MLLCVCSSNLFLLVPVIFFPVIFWFWELRCITHGNTVKAHFVLIKFVKDCSERGALKPVLKSRGLIVDQESGEGPLRFFPPVWKLHSDLP